MRLVDLIVKTTLHMIQDVDTYFILYKKT